MGKWILVPDAPCNEFFRGFPNCLVYDTPERFSALLEYALARDPVPLAPECLR